MLLEPGTILSHYRLIEKIGEGGMGVVYRALDTRLEREVALKFLPEEFANDPDRLARFIREAKIIAALNHPNIVGIHSVEEESGVRFITMELVRGRTLTQLIPRKGLPAKELLALAVPIVEAVSVAHEQGITHRDLKPDNIMVTPDGRVKILDLGLAMAKPLEPVTARSEVTTSIDETGLMIGTAAYMSPEQIEGRRLDHRSDIFALGVILYEMATGQRPFQGTSSLKVISSILHDAPPPLPDLNPLHPHELDRVIRRSLMKDRERRYQTAKDVRNDLDELKREMESGISTQPVRSRPTTRRAAYVAAVAVIMAVIGLFSMDVLRNPWSEKRVVHRNSVAVLPLKNLSADPENEYFSDGVTEDIAAQLAKVGDLRIIAGTSAARYKDRRRSATEIGSALGVATVLDGSVRRDRDRIRIVSQLLDGRTGEQLWSATYDRELKDIFAIQADVSREIAVALKGELSPADAEVLRPRHAQDLGAFDLYLKGRYYWNMRSSDGLKRSIQYFQAAIDRDPEYALAYAGLADAYNLLGVYGVVSRAEAGARASAAASKALALDASLAEAHASLALVHQERFEWDAAEQAFKRALELRPGYATAHHWYAAYLAGHGRAPDAMIEIRRALALDPLSLSINAELAAILILARRYDEAIVQLEQTLQMDPSFSMAHLMLAEAYAHKGAYDRALDQVDRARALEGTSWDLHANVGYIFAMAGRRAEAERIAAELVERDRLKEEGAAGGAAAIYAGLGQNDRAFEWLNRARDLRDPLIAYLKVDPKFDSLRGDHRFDRLLDSVGLAR
jgi:serine/threonine protein kinase/tetratricopeptide (TPR) repeat protein